MADLTGGRLELGLGAGYIHEEFEAAELAYPTARQRVQYLQHVTEFLREHVPQVPILIAGNGDRLLTVAARHAQIIGLTGGDPTGGAEDPLADRIDFVRAARRPVRRPRTEHRDHGAAGRRRLPSVPAGA